MECMCALAEAVVTASILLSPPIFFDNFYLLSSISLERIPAHTRAYNNVYPMEHTILV